MGLGESPLIIVIVVSAAILGAVGVTAYWHMKLPPEQRLGLARILGRAFAVLIAGSMLLAIIMQFGR
jgi:hypothetical protein